MKRSAAVVVTLLVGVAALVLVASPGVRETQGQDPGRKDGAVVASARLADTTAEVARVNGIPISGAEFAERVSLLEANQAEIRQLTGAGDVDGDVLLTFQRYFALDHRFGLETAALAGLVREKAVLSDALELGLDASSQEIAQRVASQREIAQRTQNADDVGEREIAFFEDYVEVVGEDRFWNELLPEWSRSVIASEKLRLHVTARAEVADPDRAWLEFELQSSLSAEVVVDPGATSVTADDVRSYLREGIALDIESLE